jgi:Bacterial antitoxin of type II TA system, VapB
MKTTLEIADPLLDEARKIAHRDGTTLRALVEQGLRQVVIERNKPPKKFKLRDASFKGGGGLTPEFENASWIEILEEAYRGRGT